MSAIINKPEEVTVIAADDVDNQRKMESLRRLISRGQGRFVFALVEFDLPSLQQEILDKLRADLPNLNLATVKLSPPPADASPELNVLDQLEDLVSLASPEKTPDALIITGYESLFADAIAKDDRPAEGLRRAVQPLNLGRNVLAEMFPCPVLLCLPPAAMGIFLQSAPDLVSWKSGFFKFESDPDAIRAKLEEAANAKINWWTRWRLRRRDPAELLAETKRLETLIADAEALPADGRLVARLYHRLGWTAVALKDRMQARWAFAEMLRRAREADDQQMASAAERGGRAAEEVITVARISSEQSAAVQRVFRGAAALTEEEGIYGREDELRELINRVTFVGARFLTVWGETGCGKTSLVLAGLLPELKRTGNYLPVVIRQWDNPEANIRQALEQSSELSLESFATLHDGIQHVARQTAKTVVVVCDQFEQFFTTHPQRSQRVSLIKAISACVNDLRISCKFIFILREDQLGRMVEFESGVPEPLEQRKRFYLPLLNSADAVRVLQLQADKAGLEWPDVFVRTVVNDLTQDGRARPIELQLVGEALAVSGIGNELDFARAGRARGLIADYLLLALDNLGQNKRLSQMIKRKLLTCLAYILSPFIRDRDKWDQRNYMERVLLTLTAEPAGRLALTLDKIVRRTGIKLEIVLPLLEILIQSHLVRRTDEPLHAVQSTDVTSVRYELTHDILTNIMPTNWLENRRWASSILARALDDVNPRPTISLDQCKVFKDYCDIDTLANPKVKALIRRSFIWGVIKKYVVWPCIFALVALAIWFALFLRGRSKGELLLTIGFTEASIGILAGETKSNHDDERRRAVGGLMSAVASNPKLASKVLQPMLASLKDNSWTVRYSAASGLGIVAQADPTLAGQILQPLLTALKDGADDIRVRAAYSLGQVVRAAPALASQTHLPLLDALGDRTSYVRNAVLHVLNRMATTDPSLSEQLFRQLTDYDTAERDGVRASLAEMAFNLTMDQFQDGHDPAQFLFKHLEGLQPLAPDGDSNIHTLRRDVIVGAMARWLVSDDPEIRAVQEEIGRRLKQMRDQDERPHIRLTAGNVLVEAAELLREKQTFGGKYPELSRPWLRDDVK